MSAKYNYDIYDKKLLAIIYYLEQQRLKLKFYEKLIKIIMNYKNLEYFYNKEAFLMTDKMNTDSV